MPEIDVHNVQQESVKEKDHYKSLAILSHHIPFDIANNHTKQNKSPKHYIINK